MSSTSSELYRIDSKGLVRIFDFRSSPLFLL